MKMHRGQTARPRISRQPRASRPRANRLLPVVESLENRWCPATSITFTGSSMVIQGDNLANDVTITDDGAGGVSATITSPAGDTSASGSGITNIQVITGGDDDTVDYTFSDALTTDRVITLNLGAGDDQATVDASPGVIQADLILKANTNAGDDTLTGIFGDVLQSNVQISGQLGNGDDSVQLDFGTILDSTVGINVTEGQGADQMTVNLGEILQGDVNVQGNLGAGDDNFAATLGGEVSGGSEVNLGVDGGAGMDAIDLIASGIDIEAGALVLASFKGGQGDDAISAIYDGVVSGMFAFSADGGAGIDTIAADLTADAGSIGSLLGSVKGGQGDDNLTLNLVDNSGTPSTLDDIAGIINSLQGTDTVVKTPNVKVV